MNAKVEVREKNFMVYCIKSCRKSQKQENPNFFIVSENIVENAEKNSLCAVRGPVSRLMDAEQIVHWQTQGKLLKNKFFWSFERKGKLEMGL